MQAFAFIIGISFGLLSRQLREEKLSRTGRQYAPRLLPPSSIVRRRREERKHQQAGAHIFTTGFFLSISGAARGAKERRYGFSNSCLLPRLDQLFTPEVGGCRRR